MTIQVELWQLITLACTLGMATIGAFWSMAQMILAQNKALIEKEFKQVKEQLDKQDDHSRRLERDLTELRIALPRDYVRREDYVQAIATISTKIDSVWLRMENLLTKMRGTS